MLGELFSFHMTYVPSAASELFFCYDILCMREKIRTAFIVHSVDLSRKRSTIIIITVLQNCVLKNVTIG
jgi:hypothetical protein